MKRRCPYLPVLFAGLGLAAAIGAGAYARPPAGGSRADREAQARVERDLKFASEMALQGLWREALFRWERVLAARPDDARILNNIGVAKEALGDREGARQAYEQALALSTEREIEDNLVQFRRLLEPPADEQEHPPPGDVSGSPPASGAAAGSREGAEAR